jgi:hypothetical protein
LEHPVRFANWLNLNYRKNMRLLLYKLIVIVIFGLVVHWTNSPVEAQTLVQQMSAISGEFTSDRIAGQTIGDPNSYLFVKVAPTDRIEEYPSDLDNYFGTNISKITISDPNNPSNTVSFTVNQNETYSTFRNFGAGFMLTAPGATAPTLGQISQAGVPTTTLPSITSSAWSWIQSLIQTRQPISINVERQLIGVENGLPVPVDKVLGTIQNQQDIISECPIGADGKPTNCMGEVLAIAGQMKTPHGAPILAQASPQIQLQPGSPIGPGTGGGGTVPTPPGGGGPSTGGAAGDPCPAVPAEQLIKDFTGVKTAVGCISSNPVTLAQQLITYILGFAGGVALLMMIIGAFEMVTSAGNPDSLKAGQERFVAAIIGLVFVVFAVTLMQIIGTDILDIPGFPGR